MRDATTGALISAIDSEAGSYIQGLTVHPGTGQIVMCSAESVKLSDTSDSTGTPVFSRKDSNEALDVLMVINALSRQSKLAVGGTLQTSATALRDSIFANLDSLDVNGEGELSPIDALLVLNRLNKAPLFNSSN